MEIKTKGNSDILDITSEVQKIIKDSKLSEGQTTIFVPGSTAGITTIEYEPGLLKDLPQAFERIAPQSIEYAHHQTWGDHNGHAHVRAGPRQLLGGAGGDLVAEDDLVARLLRVAGVHVVTGRGELGGAAGGCAGQGGDLQQDQEDANWRHAGLRAGDEDGGGGAERAQGQGGPDA